jgi:hypothetical protein
MRIQLLIPRKGESGYHQALCAEDTENNRKLILDKAKEIKGSVVLVDLNHCTVKVLYGR